MITSWSVPDASAAMASLTQSMFDSAMHKNYNYDPMLGTTVQMHNHTLYAAFLHTLRALADLSLSIYPTSYLYIQYLTKYYNVSTNINGQPTCYPTSSKTTLSPQILHTIYSADSDWLTTTRRRDDQDYNDLKLNVLPEDAYNTLPGFEQCTYGTAIGRLTTKGPVLSMTATTVSYINNAAAPILGMAGMGGGDHMHMNPTDTALGLTGAAPGAAIPKGASPPTATAQSGTLAASGASMNMPMPSGEKMELCDLLTVGAAVFTGTSGTFAIGEKVLTPGGPPITLFGTVVSEPMPTAGGNATVAVVAGTTQEFLRTVMREADLNKPARATAGGDSKATSDASRSLSVISWLVAACLGTIILL